MTSYLHRWEQHGCEMLLPESHSRWHLLPNVVDASLFVILVPKNLRTGLSPADPAPDFRPQIDLDGPVRTTIHVTLGVRR